jgi:drug/metabolite transporter (DMT)-like permease
MSAVLARPPSTALPVTVLLFSATLWGLSWWPLKGFAAAGLAGPVLVLLTYGVVGLIGLPWLLHERRRWQGEGAQLLLLAIVGGWANAAFVSALVLGDVVRVMLLFYLSPVWSVLGGRIFLGERLSHRRMAAVALSLAGAFLVFGGVNLFGAAFSAADLLALSAGLAFAGNNIVSRAAQRVPMASKTVSVFAGSGVASLFMLALGPVTIVWPTPSLPLVAALAAYAFGWMVLATATWQYGVTHVEAGRAGVIMTAELVIALVSASLLGQDTLSAIEWLGGALIAAAALVEATDTPTPVIPAKAGIHDVSQHWIPASAGMTDSPPKEPR